MVILSVSDFFIKRPVFATVCSIVITLLGIACIPTLPIAQYPDIAPPQVGVTANYVGANAEVVESTVTNILERELNGITGVKFIKSTSANNGVSNINLTFDLGRDQDLAAVDVQNRVSTVQSRLPGPVTQTGVQVTKTNNNFLLAIGIYSEKDPKKNQDFYDDLYLSNYADLYLRDALRRLKGVGEVQIFGERTYAMRIWLDPERLAARTLTPQDVVQALRQQNVQVGAGQIGQAPAVPGQEYQYSVTAQGRLKEAEEFNNLVIRTAQSGALVRLRDIGRAELGAENYGSLLRFTTQDRVTHRGVGLGVNQQFGSNALDVAKAVKDEMQRLSSNFPPGLKYDVAFDTTVFIEAGAREVVDSLIQAIILVVLILFLFLQDWRAALITSIVIPIAFLGTFIFVKILGFSINTLTLFGLTLATGLVVDDAIVIIEDITRRIQDEDMNPVEAAIASMNTLSGVVIATSLVLMTVFVPVAFFPGTTGQLYRQFALTITFSVAVSTFNALTFTPMLSALLLRRGQTASNNWFFRRVNLGIDKTRDAYARNLDRVVRKKGLVLTFFAGALALTYFVYNLVPQAFIPDEDQGVFITIVQAPEGVSLGYTEKVLEKAEAILKAQPEVANIFAVGGFSFSGATPNNGIIFTTLKPWDQRRGADQSLDSIIGGFFPKPFGLFPKMASIQEAVVLPFNLPAISGIGNFGGFEFHLQDRTNLGFQAMGETLGKFIGRATAYPSPQSPQIAQLRPNFNGNTPQIAVEVDRDRANQLQVPLDDIFNTLQVFLGSTYVNDFNQFNRAYRVYVQADQQYRSNPEDIKKLYVRSTTGQMISMGNLVKVTQNTGPSIITHYNLFRSIELNGAPAPGASSGQAIQAMEAVARETLPRGFGFEWSGLSLEEIESGGAAFFIFGLAIVFVFLTLAAQYENYIDPVIIMLTVPLAILGALLAVLLRGTANDVYTQIGFVMLIGMASKNSILIVEFANEERAAGKGIASAVVAAGRERLRPILMTAISTAIGALPLVIATGPGAAARQSLGTAIVGGMVVATFLSLFIVPVLYIVIKGFEDRLRKPAKRLAPVDGSLDGNSKHPRESAATSERD
ncbi:MAG: efflux RND transporter permease subunit [Leptolyngbya sp. UWPOB_LEPTO1]|uniref:efflux RND transporter permease subunit n=1 Tax=Leptolyngbya sp. UWPOB_LEPTO1 TaxID=2815653 RepID=UPI001AC498A7|nr:efflux RND transporter permease subunit [Leptolyngbya sp. UWPOB_LEPTO1]MBN8561304.1 efflux RND transporter permease subunit [Leptolyngbya sp. UWPOB_LEPTO1]